MRSASSNLVSSVKKAPGALVILFPSAPGVCESVSQSGEGPIGEKSAKFGGKILSSALTSVGGLSAGLPESSLLFPTSVREADSKPKLAKLQAAHNLK